MSPSGGDPENVSSVGAEREKDFNGLDSESAECCCSCEERNLQTRTSSTGNELMEDRVSKVSGGPQIYAFVIAELHVDKTAFIKLSC